MKKRIFAKGYCFPKIFIFFVIGCVIGTYYEELLYFIKTGTYSSRQGLFYGPFSPIYGFGVAIFILFLGKNNDKRSILKTFLYACLIGGLTEYLVGFISEFFFDIKFWDYSKHFLNINGRTTIPFILGWGILGTVLVKWIYPFLSKWIEKIPYLIGKIIYITLLVFISLDMLITYTAFGRMALRHQGKNPITFIGKFYDKVYDDEFMYKRYPAMRVDD